MPGLQGAAQGQLDAARLDLTDQRKAELEMRLKPGHVEGVTALFQLGQHVLKVHADKAGEQKAVMQLGPPARELAAVGLAPEAGDQRAQQQLLRNAHARMRRHLEGAQFKQTQAAGSRVRRIKFVDTKFAAVGVAGHVDQNIAQGAVHNPGWHVVPRRAHRVGVDFAHRPAFWAALAVLRGGVRVLPVFLAEAGDLAQGNFKFVELVVARFVDARCLAGGADEEA